MPFVIPGATPLNSEYVVQSGSVWVGHSDGEFIVIGTFPTEVLEGTDLTADHIRLDHIGQMYSVLSDEILAETCDLAPRNVVDTVWAEMQDLEFTSSILEVDGSSVPADLVTYRKLDFIFGRDFTMHPVVMAKKTETGSPWPEISFVNEELDPPS